MWVLLRWLAGFCLLMIVLSVPMNPLLSLALFWVSAAAMLSSVLRVAR